MPKTIYLKSKKNYIALKYACSDRLNAGLIEKCPHGILNARQYLIDDITVEKGDFRDKEFNGASGVNHTTKGVGGSGYIGWRNPGSIAGAVAYLLQYFDVKTCDDDAQFYLVLAKKLYQFYQLDRNFIRDGYKRSEWGNKRGQSVYTKPGNGTVIVITELTPKSSSPADVDAMFKEIQDELNDRLQKGEKLTDIFFQGGGTIPIPDWFKDWCLKKGIRVHVMDAGC